MDMPNPETVTTGGTAILALGALVNSLWDKWRAHRTKEQLYKKIEDMGDEISKNAVYAAANYATRHDLSTLQQRIDLKLDNIQGLMVELIRSTAKS